MANQFIIHGLSEEGKAYRAALVAIQKLHYMDEVGFDRARICGHCSNEFDVPFPCATRQLADKGLEGERG